MYNYFHVRNTLYSDENKGICRFSKTHKVNQTFWWLAVGTY